jgi:hypothetical protein
VNPPVCYAVRAERTSPRWCTAFAAGSGGRLVDAVDPMLEPGPIALFGSVRLWPLLLAAQREGRTWYYGDHGYFARKQYFRITRNRYQHDGAGESSGRRFRGLRLPIFPWRRSGRRILLAMHSPAFYALHGERADAWELSVRAALATATDRPIVTRYKDDPIPIKRALVDAWALVTFASGAALDALRAGVPVFVLAPFAAAASMGSADLTRIEDPVYPEDRARFLSVLADNQWDLHEIARGTAWRALADGA